MKTIFDFLLICLVGVVAGFWVNYGTSSLGFADFIFVRPVSPSEDVGTFADIENTIAPSLEEQRNKTTGRQRTYEWLNDGHRFIAQIENLEEANCSDKAMRQYARSLQNLDTSAFDQQTGRLIGGDGEHLSRFQWRMLQKVFLPLQPLAYFRDELVPDNFKHVMIGISLKKNWKTCKFDIAGHHRMPSFKFSNSESINIDPNEIRSLRDNLLRNQIPRNPQ